MISLSEYEWATLNWMVDAESLRLDQDILQTVLEWSHHHVTAKSSEHFVNDAFKRLLDHYLNERVKDWGTETLQKVTEFTNSNAGKT